VEGSDGWPGEDGRKTTDDLPALDVRKLKRAGLIGPGQKQLEGVAHLAWTPCNFGGSRPWFVCPGDGCARRVAILYGPEPGQLLCRHCRDLTYQSQRTWELGRAEWRTEKAAERLAPDGGRPKGMHHTTFLKLTRDYLEAVEEQEALTQERLARLTWRQTAHRVRSLKWRRRNS
jgi:hypothetical protein